MTTVKTLDQGTNFSSADAIYQEQNLSNLASSEFEDDLDLNICDDVGLTDEELEAEGQTTRSLTSEPPYTQMDASGPGFMCYGPVEKRYGRAQVIQILKKISTDWAKDYPNGPVLRIGNISYQMGGEMKPHKSHRQGIDVDFGPVSKTNEALPLTWQASQYSRERTQDLVKRFQNNGILDVRIILFNDPNVSGVQSCPGHHDHLHVSFMPSGFKAPGQYSSDATGNLRLVRPFMKGDRVKQLQADLSSVKFPIEPDGVFGDHTDKAVRAFQSAYGLEVDGIAGKNTLAKLAEVKAKQTAPSNGTASVVSGQAKSKLQQLIEAKHYFDYGDVASCSLHDDQDLCREIQTILQAIGLLNTVDGLFGSHTQAALREFKARYQLAGGDIFGPTTAEALLDARPASGKLPNWSGGNKQETIQAIIKEARRQGISDLNQIAYILATAEHETAGSFQPVKEAYFLGEPRGENHRRTLTYYPYYGRGFVQLTWDYNYRKYSDILGLDLVGNPDLVMRPDISLFILVDGMKRGVFTGKKLSDYFSNGQCDWLGPRRVINGTDRAAHVADLARNWRSKLS